MNKKKSLFYLVLAMGVVLSIASCSRPYSAVAWANLGVQLIIAIALAVTKKNILLCKVWQAGSVFCLILGIILYANKLQFQSSWKRQAIDDASVEEDTKRLKDVSFTNPVDYLQQEQKNKEMSSQPASGVPAGTKK